MGSALGLSQFYFMSAAIHPKMWNNATAPNFLVG